MPKQRTAKQKAATRKLVALNKRRSSTKKGGVRKTARRAYEPKRKSSQNKRKSSPSNTRKRSNSMPKRRATGARGKAKNFLKSGIIGQAVTGIGAAALIGTVMNKVLPGSPITSIAQPIAAYAAGGGVGAVASVLLSGGLNSITGFLGGQQNGTTQVGQMEFGV
jgi:hypothetical protein|tara:strand:- start:297 stop:788 length:492 start_codon:yes stop_codon:yes gene_type:complete